MNQIIVICEVKSFFKIQGLSMEHAIKVWLVKGKMQRKDHLTFGYF